MAQELQAVLLGLASAASWGAADFSGGLASKRSSPYIVVLIAELAGVVPLIAFALLLGESPPDGSSIVWGIIAGIGGTVGLVALYQGLALNRMGIIAPLTALLAGALPILAGIFMDGLPSAVTLVGFGCAFVAVWLIADTGGDNGVTLQVLLLPLLAGVSLGIGLFAIAQMSQDTVLFPLAIARSVSTGLLLVVVAVTKTGQTPARRQLPLIILAGLLDTGGGIFFAFAIATQVGRLDITATLGSLYPAMTIVLARMLLKEELSRRQWIGVTFALIAVVLIAV